MSEMDFAINNNTSSKSGNLPRNSNQDIKPASCSNNYLVEIQKENQQLSQEVESLYAAAAQLEAITNSRGYRFLQVVYSIRLYLIPRLSLREHLVIRICRTLRSIVHLSKNLWQFLKPNRRTQECAAMAREPNGRAPEAALPIESPCDAENNQSTALLGFAAPETNANTGRGYMALHYAPQNWKPREAARSDDRFIKLIILSAVHRSGSTLLQRICNARKGTLIWGEHGGLLSHFADIYTNAAFYSHNASQESIQYFSHGENPNLWIGSICPDLSFVQQAVIESARTFLNTMYGQYRETHDIIGFKEVHYSPREFGLIRQCYPDADIMLLVRNPLNTWNSTPRSWYPSFAAWLEKWQQNAQYFMALAKMDAKCQLLRHEDVVGQEKSTMAILAETAKVSPKQIAMVLANKIGSSHVGISEQERQTILQHCREPMENLGYL
jgi:hypothetical protein